MEDLSYTPDKGTSPYPAVTHTNQFLKQVSMEIAPMLTHLFQQSLRDMSIPAVWKQAHVTPVYKKGDRLNPKKYLPVSLTSLICKTMEHVLVSQHLE